MKALITKNGLKLLNKNLDEKLDILKSIRKEKAHAYTASGDGWHDNPGWTQLGQQEEMLAKEINLLQQKISNAILIDTSNQTNDIIQIGSKVEYLILKKQNIDSLIQTVYIVGSGETDVRNKKISYDSPIGKALCNMVNGEEKDVLLPGGLIKIKIQKISYE